MNATVTGTGDFGTGGITGYLYIGNLLNCHFVGTVNATTTTKGEGLRALRLGGGTISNCTDNGNVINES